MTGILGETEKANIVEFCNQMIVRPFIREDYSELLELSLLCVDDSSAAKFRRPGALHHARWMAKAIYGIKMYLFRSQFEVECQQLERFVLFVIRVYLKGWYEAPLGTNAPLNDLNFMNGLLNYPDKEVSAKTSKKFEKHLWYLSEINISLAFFDNNVDDEVKRRMVKNLKKRSSGKNLIRLKKFSTKKGLEQLVTENSFKFFEILKIDPTFLLEEDPKNWINRSDYTAAKMKCDSLVVINDPAERALGAASNYNEFGPKDDLGKQELLMVVAENRKIQCNSLKTSVINYLKK